MSVDNLAIAKATAMDIRSLHSFHFKKSVVQKLYKSYGAGFNMLDILRSLGRYSQVSNEILTAEEEAYDHRTITVGSSGVSVGGSAGATASFQLDADDLDSEDNYYPREKFNVLFGSTANGFIQALITDITVTGGGTTVTLTVTPTDTTKTISATYLYAGVEISIGASAFAAEMSQPDATSVGYFERTFHAQLMKETIGFGGMELAKQKWVEVEGIGYFNKELSRAEFALDRQLETTMIMGQMNTNSITQTSDISGSSNTVYMNKGIWTWIDELGGAINYTNSASIGIDDFDEAADYFETQGITNDIVLVLCGGDYLRRVENTCVEYFSNPGGASTQGGGLSDIFIDKISASGGEPGLDLNIGFRTIKKGGILFVFHKLPIFTNPYLFGIGDYLLNDAAIMCPVTYVKERKSGLTVPNLEARYVGLGSYSRERIVGTIGGMDGFATQHFGNPIISQIDGNFTYWLSHCMFPFYEAYKGILHKRSS